MEFYELIQDVLKRHPEWEFVVEYDTDASATVLNLTAFGRLSIKRIVTQELIGQHARPIEVLRLTIREMEEKLDYGIKEAAAPERN